MYQSSDRISCLPFCNVPIVVISRAKSQFADLIFVYRRSVEIVLLLIDCCFSISWTRYFIWSILAFIYYGPSPTLRFSGPYFTVFGLNTEYTINLRIQSKIRENMDQKNSVFGQLLRSPTCGRAACIGEPGIIQWFPEKSITMRFLRIVRTERNLALHWI